MNFKYNLWIVSLSLVSLIWGCRGTLDEKLGCTDPRSLNYDPEAVYDNGECEYSDSYRYFMPEYWSRPDEEGNLLVVNQTESPLHLYAENTHMKVIPPKTNDFLVDVPVKTDVTLLSLYKAENVDHVEDPPAEKFKSWRVVLGATTSVKGPVGWVVSDLVTGSGAGSLMLSYKEAGEEDNRLPCNVDVYLHSKTGGRVTSIEPGTDNKEVRLDFGTYRLWFHYWESDPNSSEGYKTLGWRNTSDLVLNSGTKLRDVEVPSFEKVPENAAALSVLNRFGTSINVKLGDRLIENLVVGREDTRAMSTIADRDSMLYPTDAGRYLLNFDDLQGTSLGKGFDVDLEPHFVAHVVAGEERKTVVLDNTTDRQVFLGNKHYLGISANAKTIRDVTIPARLTDVMVFDADSTFFREMVLDSDTLKIVE